MYEELVKQCRGCLDSLCGECKYEHLQNAGNFVPCMNALLGEATNAIEELQGKNFLMKKTAEWVAEKVPKWIPVTERLPEEPYGCLAIVWDNPRYDGDMFLNYYPEFVGWDGETWNDADGEEIPLDVVYWMKMPQIPEPPKEGE